MAREIIKPQKIHKNQRLTGCRDDLLQRQVLSLVACTVVFFLFAFYLLCSLMINDTFFLEHPRVREQNGIYIILHIKISLSHIGPLVICSCFFNGNAPFAFLMF